MPNTPALVKQSDITRAVKAVIAAGLQVRAVRTTLDGEIIVLTNDADVSNVKSDWD